jgi:hypothetical protein
LQDWANILLSFLTHFFYEGIINNIFLHNSLHPPCDDLDFFLAEQGTIYTFFVCNPAKSGKLFIYSEDLYLSRSTFYDLPSLRGAVPALHRGARESKKSRQQETSVLLIVRARYLAREHGEFGAPNVSQESRGPQERPTQGDKAGRNDRCFRIGCEARRPRPR